MRTNVEITGIAELQARFKDPALIKGPLEELLRETARIGKQIARHNIKGGTEQAGISIRADVEPLVATVYSVMPHARALSIEEGRFPGDAPPFKQIVRWVKGRYASTRNVSASERQVILEIMASVKAKGTKGKKFIAGAAVAIKKSLPGLVQKMARKVEERWRQR